ncbi:uncharacterized protein MYCFIDRAFT_33406 [Pseudocercospora fijiensis CIRAD86]|uniref:RecQ-mediated genome instability protein 1 n=1 Tax=Pseudocercospora fijiensis (strain CIRAD86) TaxID=383855 RepID=M3A122_PSEFD|nr:uncharacterized protein MYCFIDRAFT_33406 [Pseudocercospora fijiensis CIRAD86]EME78096.1 hypothetical protein MYCFIDRAFT_33406 [Pseudocercospora fijiensis CIRAD86]
MPPSTASGDVNQLFQAIQAHLASKHIPPTQQWLQNFVPTLRLTTPLMANQKTAEYRLLQTDICSTVQSTPHSTFSAGITSPEVQEQRVPGPVPVQVLDVEDIGRSRWSQVEAIEMEERGETKRGHEVIRVVAETEDENQENQTTTGANTQSGPHKLLLQDCKGTKVYAFELENVKGIGIDLAIGSKLVIKDFVVSRGVVMLTNAGTEVLGGKVEAWDKRWREDRKKVLKEKAGWREGMGIDTSVT